MWLIQKSCILSICLVGALICCILIIDGDVEVYSIKEMEWDACKVPVGDTDVYFEIIRLVQLDYIILQINLKATMVKTQMRMWMLLKPMMNANLFMNMTLYPAPDEYAGSECIYSW